MNQMRKPRIKPGRPDAVNISIESQSLSFDEVTIVDVDCEARKLDELYVNSCEVLSLSLRSATVKDIKIVDSELRKCDFTGAVSHHTFFERVHISSSRLQGSQFMECMLSNVMVEQSKCNDSSFRFGKLRDITFIGCDLTGADFSGAILKNIDFRQCNLLNSQFSHAKLDHVSFKDSDITGIAINKDSLGGITVNTGQALYLASMLGLTTED